MLELSVGKVRELKGAPLAVLVLLSLAPLPVSKGWLMRSSGYTDKPVKQACAYLQEQGIIDCSRSGWFLAAGLQLPLGVGNSSDFGTPDNLIGMADSRGDCRAAGNQGRRLAMTSSRVIFSSESLAGDGENSSDLLNESRNNSVSWAGEIWNNSVSLDESWKNSGFVEDGSRNNSVSLDESRKNSGFVEDESRNNSVSLDESRKNSGFVEDESRNNSVSLDESRKNSGFVEDESRNNSDFLGESRKNSGFVEDGSRNNSVSLVESRKNSGFWDESRNNSDFLGESRKNSDSAFSSINSSLKALDLKDLKELKDLKDLKELNTTKAVENRKNSDSGPVRKNPISGKVLGSASPVLAEAVGQVLESSEPERPARDAEVEAALWKQLYTLGLRHNSRTDAMAAMEHVTLEYVRALAAKMEAQGKGGVRHTGLFIQACERGEQVETLFYRLVDEQDRLLGRGRWAALDDDDDDDDEVDEVETQLGFYFGNDREVDEEVGDDDP